MTREHHGLQDDECSHMIHGGRRRQAAVFLDKDGTLIEDRPFFQRPEMTVQLLPGVVDGLRLLHDAGFLLVIVTNQGGVAQGRFTEDDVLQMEDGIRRALAVFEIPLSRFYYCPHHPQGTIPHYAIRCRCRKPGSGMLMQAAEDLHVDLGHSWMVGDILHDVEAGRSAGCRTVLIDNGNETEWVMSDMRWPHVVAEDMLTAARVIVEAPPSPSPFVGFA
jgi:D,D-heptose 1,7-bisphosphate phosphatase